VIPGFRCTFLPDMPSSLIPGEFGHRLGPDLRCRRGLRQDSEQHSASQSSRNPFRAGMFTRLPGSRFCYGLSVARAPVRIRLERPPPEGFYVQAFNGSVSLPLLDMPTRATGLLCWRDFHPLEWQLASLYQIIARLSATTGWLVCRAGSQAFHL
jgi:hypothetical protein